MKKFIKLTVTALAGAVIIASTGCANSGSPVVQSSDNESETVTTETTVEEDDGISVGDHIMFGNYPQNNGNDSEPVEWRVLEIKDGKALVISEYLLEPKAYNIELSDVTWENSSLRKWLNGDFYDKAFGWCYKGRVKDNAFTYKMWLVMKSHMKNIPASSWRL